MKVTTLSIENLTIGFESSSGKSEILHEVSLSVEKGQTLALVGESGSGKSVTSLHIMKLLDYDSAYVKSGEIFLANQEISSLGEGKMNKLRGKKMAMVFQEPMTSLNPVMKCGKQVEEVIRLHNKCTKKEAKEKVLSLFEQVQLPQPKRAYNSYPHQLSGGQKQRIVIAIAISCNPELLIADEPTTALDVTVQKSILQLLKKLQKEGEMALVFISHDLGVVAEIADQICVLYRGKVVEAGEAKEVLRNPKHPYTQGLLACKPPVLSRPVRLLTVQQIIETPGIKPKLWSEEERRKHLSDLESSSKILEVRSLTKIFHARQGIWGTKSVVKAVDAVNFNVKRGEIFGLVGESGCGKTTLSRLILGLIKPTSGTVFFKGEKVDLSSNIALKTLRKNMQIIFQDPYSSLNPKMKVGRAIMEPMTAHNLYSAKEERRHQTKLLLEKVGMKNSDFDKYPHEFSGGQRQRLVIARTLAMNPEFIICDESVSALDVSVQAQILNLLNDLKDSLNLSLIFISHDLAVVKYMCDRIMVMNGGRIEEIQEAELLFNHTKSAYTRKLIAAIPGNHSEIQKRLG